MVLSHLCLTLMLEKTQTDKWQITVVFSLKDEVHPRRIAPVHTHDERAIQRTKDHKIL